jgi:hypothetical protein
MSEPIHNSTGHGDYERRDIGVAGVLYFLAGLAFAGIVVYFVVAGLYAYLEKGSQAQQLPMSPLVTNTPTDTRHIPMDYPKAAFPDPKLEEDERGQLNGIRLTEEQTLSSYDSIDQKTGTVRIPIERAMDLIAQRGLPMRGQGAPTASPAAQSATLAAPKTKGIRK